MKKERLCEERESNTKARVLNIATSHTSLDLGGHQDVHGVPRGRPGEGHGPGGNPEGGAEGRIQPRFGSRHHAGLDPW